ncbi:MAG: LLM class flavin-dependent oxidoreductase, partial [Nocardioidaceae bacterium]
MTSVPLPLAVLDFVGIEHGERASDSIAGAVKIAQAVEDAGYHRYWVSEHHNMSSLACSAPEILTAHIGARTDSIRVGAAGIMLPNHAPFKVAETFRTLLAMYPGRVDLA